MTDARDALTSLAPMLRVRPELQDYCRFGGDWCARHDPEERGWAAFHIVLKGRCMVERHGQMPVALKEGDVLLLPQGDAHVVFGGDDREAFRPISYTSRDYIRVKQTAGTDIETELVCGRFHLESSSENLVLQTLPRTVLLTLGGIDGCRGLIGMIADELEQDRAGAAAITRDLARAMFVMLLRRCFETQAPVQGLLALLAARETGRAAAAMLEAPARPWDLDELAAIAAVSRPSLVRAFRRITGLPPFGFLAELRLGMAHHKIAKTSEPLAQIAADAGYQSEAALSRAFLRRFEIRPGALRRAEQGVK
ncbi:AraC family transcriptional regulator [Novosphingobium terrae]|uniref:AraC family transcriptional regulator n=1 Tax=Novosphingobium terrae TaxID=2726189 RepID=UPI001980989A|nr:AraC family transcriptional regulator [Novosphingobium terrae]